MKSYEFVKIAKKTKNKGEIFSKFKIDERFEGGNSPLHLFISLGDILGVKYLLSRGVSPNITNNIGRTGLMIAALMNEYNMVECLINMGAEVNKKDTNGWTALLLSSVVNSYESAKLLLFNGANPNTSNIYGSSPLSRSIANGYEALSFLLFDFGAKITPQVIESALINAQVELLWKLESRS